MKQSVYLLLIAFFAVACENSTSDELAVFDFGKGKYKQPFVGWLKSEPEILVKSLKYPPYKWFAPDTLVLGAEFNIDFNDESVRSKSSATLRFADTLAHPVSGVEFFCNEQPIRDGGIAVDASDNDRRHVKIKCKVQPKVGERRVVGYLIADGNELDEINEIPLQHEQNVVAKWSLEQKYGWPIMLWLLWALTVALILVALYFLIKGLVLLFIVAGKYLAAIKIASIALPKLRKTTANPRKSSHNNGQDNWRIRVKRRTGWSDEIISALRSEEEAKIYIAARLVEKRVNGRPALVNPTIDGRAFNCRKKWLKDKLADYDRWKDYNNADLMGEGYPPRDSNGDPYELHHIGQHQDSPFAELTWQQHMGDGNNAILHPQRESEIDRQQFDHEKAAHWMARFEDFKNCYD